MRPVVCMSFSRNAGVAGRTYQMNVKVRCGSTWDKTREPLFLISGPSILATGE